MATSFFMEHDAEALAKLPLVELSQEIIRCLWVYKNGRSSDGRKVIFKRSNMFEQSREQPHGVAENSDAPLLTAQWQL